MVSLCSIYLPNHRPCLPSRPLRSQRHTKAVAIDNDVSSSNYESSVVLLPGSYNTWKDYAELQADLEANGIAVDFCDVRRIDWFRNGRGLIDPNYWRGTLNPRPTVDWYLRRLDEALERVKRRTDGTPITLIAHSAGGWLGRLYMKDFGTTGIENFVTLGSPHLPPPEIPGIFDQTGGILSFLEQEIPGTFHSDVNYVTVSGKYIKGSKWNDDSSSFAEKITGQIYKQLCGEASVWGDGIVPSVSSHLDGALHVELTDVYHSPIGSVHEKIDTETDKKQRVWYGSKGVREEWMALLPSLRAIQNQI